MIRSRNSFNIIIKYKQQELLLTKYIKHKYYLIRDGLATEIDKFKKIHSIKLLSIPH